MTVIVKEAHRLPSTGEAVPNRIHEDPREMAEEILDTSLWGPDVEVLNAEWVTRTDTETESK